MSALPKQVQASIDEANRIAAEIKAQQEADAARAAAPPPTETPAAVSPAPGPVAAQVQPAPPAPATPAQPSDGFEQKYRVLQGKYNAEVPRLQGQTRELTETVRRLEQQLTAQQMLVASLSQNRGAAPEGQRSTPSPTTKLVKDEEVADFGADLFDFVQRAARQAVMPEVEERLRPMAQRVDQVSQAAHVAAADTADTKRERVHALLDREVPKWREMNEDTADGGFIAWLAQADAFSGKVRGELLKEAYEQHDGPRVVSFFKGFLNENAIVTPQPAPSTGGPQKTLEDYVAPGTAKPGTTGAPNEAGKRTWTEAEIGKFYSDVRAGVYRRDAAKKTEIEHDIFKAQAEGRVRIR
jgi:hypothetical protein